LTRPSQRLYALAGRLRVLDATEQWYTPSSTIVQKLSKSHVLGTHDIAVRRWESMRQEGSAAEDEQLLDLRASDRNAQGRPP